jgi:hypothetical protein
MLGKEQQWKTLSARYFQCASRKSKKEGCYHSCKGGADRSSTVTWRGKVVDCYERLYGREGVSDCRNPDGKVTAA